jgi:hypothetical protein
MERPPEYQHWPEHAQSTFNERIAIALEGNNLPMDKAVPEDIIAMATKAAIEAIQKNSVEGAD